MKELRKGASEIVNKSQSRTNYSVEGEFGDLGWVGRGWDGGWALVGQSERDSVKDTGWWSLICELYAGVWPVIYL